MTTVPPDQHIATLQIRFGPTLAELRLALRLITGETLQTAARTLDISYENARTILKKVFLKTGTNRQTELVIVILTATVFATSE